MDNTLKIGIPKGSLEEATLSLFARAGFRFYGAERSLWLTSNDPGLKPVLLRPQEIPRYVASGSLDCGLAGHDWIMESACDEELIELADLCYSKRSFRPVRWVLAVAKDAPYNTVQDLKKIKNPPLRIATELHDYTSDWITKRGINAKVEFSWGATEAKVPMFADAIVECTETGASLAANGLRILDTVLESTTRFFANRRTYLKDEAKRAKLDGIALLLKSCLAAETHVSVRLQAQSQDMEKLKALVPKTAKMTAWMAQDNLALIEILIDKDECRELIPVLARNGAQKISVATIGMLYE